MRHWWDANSVECVETLIWIAIVLCGFAGGYLWMVTP